MGLDFSQVTHPQLGEEGEAQVRDPRKEVSSQPSLLPPALFISFPLASPPLCLALEMKMPSLSSLWVIPISLSESKMEKQTPGKRQVAEWRSRVMDGKRVWSLHPGSPPSLQDLSLPFLLLPWQDC